MRFLVCAGLVVLLMFICLPVGVSAAGSDTVTVSGSIGISIDVSAAQKTIDFASMAAGVDESGQSTITVATTSTSWSVTASDARAVTKGYMYKTGDVKLASPFRLSKDNSVFTPLTSDISNFMSGTSAGTFNQIAYVKQSISPADSSGSYSITTTFTGSAT